MACFLVPTAEAIVLTAVTQIVKNKEGKRLEYRSESKTDFSSEETHKTPFSRKLKWLTNLLWGGSVLLAFEHLWHGEISPMFPFLTAASNPADAKVMLHEMATVGVTMSVVVTVVWAAMVAISNASEKKALSAKSEKESAK